MKIIFKNMYRLDPKNTGICVDLHCPMLIIFLSSSQLKHVVAATYLIPKKNPLDHSIKALFMSICEVKLLILNSDPLTIQWLNHK